MLVNIIKKRYPEVEVTKISPNIEDCLRFDERCKRRIEGMNERMREG